ncbi:MAG TPA: glycosyl hydrolase 53 family protein [Verrucomicrobiae bacterium]|nr:glycosyl hydrolase 53 family protein [Verrucomicrobiae bacterium]
MNILLRALSVAIVVLLAGLRSAEAYDFAFGADLSFLKQAEDNGMVFRDGTNAMPGLQIFRNHGYNWIRLRLFVEPVGNHLPNNLAYTLAEARAAKGLGYKFLLDLHYANSWADPGKQPTPETWKNLSHRQRVKKLFEYSRDTIAAFREGSAMPDMVQIGNEVTHGMLWPDGRLPEHWKDFADYIRAGIQGVRAGAGKSAAPKIMIHIDQGGNIARTKYFFDNLNRYGIQYDVIGFSFYPWWHGTLMDLRENLAFAARRYHKDVVVVETAYHWRPNREDAARPGPGPFPETPQGQRDFLEAVANIVMDTPDGRGKGVFWWEPAVGGHGGLVSRSFFDEEGNSLPVLDTFDKYTRPAWRPDSP